MLIECLIQREGPTVAKAGGFRFTFEKNEAGHCVCDVNAGGAVVSLLAQPFFRSYNPDQDYANTTARIPVISDDEPAPDGVLTGEHAEMLILAADANGLKASEIAQQYPQLGMTRQKIVLVLKKLKGE